MWTSSFYSRYGSVAGFFENGNEHGRFINVEKFDVHMSFACLALTNLTFICPCIASISLKYNQQDATFSRSIYFYKLLYMFHAVPPPIIRSTKLYIQRQVLSN